MTESFFKQEYSNILRRVKIISREANKHYLKLENEDIQQEIMTYIFSTCGDLEYNFGNTEIFYKKMYARTRKYILGKIIDMYINDSKSLSIDNMEEEMPLDKQKVYIDKTINIAEETELSDFSFDNYGQILQIMSQGFSFEASLDYLAKQKNIAKEILYQEIKERAELALKLQKNE